SAAKLLSQAARKQPRDFSADRLGLLVFLNQFLQSVGFPFVAEGIVLLKLTRNLLIRRLILGVAFGGGRGARHPVNQLIHLLQSLIENRLFLLRLVTLTQLHVFLVEDAAEHQQRGRIIRVETGGLLKFILCRG